MGIDFTKPVDPELYNLDLPTYNQTKILEKLKVCNGVKVWFLEEGRFYITGDIDLTDVTVYIHKYKPVEFIGKPGNNKIHIGHYIGPNNHEQGLKFSGCISVSIDNQQYY